MRVCVCVRKVEGSQITKSFFLIKKNFKNVISSSV